MGHPYTISKMWTNIGLPFRPAMGTMDTWVQQYPTFTAPLDTKEFDHLQTLANVTKHADWLAKRLRSPTGCRLQQTLKPTIDGWFRFYIDSQGTPEWFWHPGTGQVRVAIGNGNNTPLVAESLPEFFARMAMENDIVHATSLLSIKDRAVDRQFFLVGVRSPRFEEDRLQVNDEQLWVTEAPKYLTPAQMKYLHPFYEEYLVQKIPLVHEAIAKIHEDQLKLIELQGRLQLQLTRLRSQQLSAITASFPTSPTASSAGSCSSLSSAASTSSASSTS